MVNNLNEAIFLRTGDGIIGYCNDLGLRYIRSISDDIFPDEQNLD